MLLTILKYLETKIGQYPLGNIHLFICFFMLTVKAYSLLLYGNM